MMFKFITCINFFLGKISWLIRMQNLSITKLLLNRLNKFHQVWNSTHTFNQVNTRSSCVLFLSSRVKKSEINLVRFDWSVCMSVISMMEGVSGLGLHNDNVTRPSIPRTESVGWSQVDRRLTKMYFCLSVLGVSFPTHVFTFFAFICKSL